MWRTWTSYYTIYSQAIYALARFCQPSCNTLLHNYTIVSESAISSYAFNFARIWRRQWRRVLFHPLLSVCTTCQDSLCVCYCQTAAVNNTAGSMIVCSSIILTATLVHKLVVAARCFLTFRIRKANLRRLDPQSLPGTLNTWSFSRGGVLECP